MPLIFLTLMLRDFIHKVTFKGVIYPLKYDVGRDPMVTLELT
jgi:hypothetical protein